MWTQQKHWSMDDLTKKHLQDILSAIEEIESFFGDKPKLFDDFYSNLCLRRAIERNIEIIGEAMNRILKTDKNIAITNSRKIVDARNYIIHGYDSLSADILWSMVINHLPKLRNEVTTLLSYEWNTLVKQEFSLYFSLVRKKFFSNWEIFFPNWEKNTP